GFSGGPLIDAAGRVLGINTSALARGVPVTIPVATVERVVTELLERGSIRRAYLGIGTQPVRVPASLARKVELKSDVALLIVSLESGGPADREGSGLVITNAHVVQGNQATIELGDGSVARARVVARDPKRDLAALELELEPARAMAPTGVRDSPLLRAGELVIAIGHPGGFVGA